MPRFCVLFLVISLCTFFGIGGSPGKACSAASSILHLDFTTLPTDVRDGLSGYGFTFERQMKDRSAINLSAADGRLNIVTSGPTQGLMVKQDLHIAHPEVLEITWGIEGYPEGAAWHLGRKKEAVMVLLFFGAPLPADNFYLPDMPYFLGIFLGEHEPPFQPFASENYSGTGRYVCLGNPPPGQTIITRLNLRDAFRDWFGHRAIPPVTGIAIEVDTGDLPEEEAYSSAFIYQISLKTAE